VTDILEEYQHPHMPYPFSLPPFSGLDIYIPGMRIAFEYHGLQHYKDLHNMDQADLEFDMKKEEACRRIGISLISIPHWEDINAEKLIQILLEHRPDLADALKQGFFPIPSQT
jgi:hypothetical protein